MPTFRLLLNVDRPKYLILKKKILRHSLRSKGLRWDVKIILSGGGLLADISSDFNEPSDFICTGNFIDR
jgi:hypothetical protein